MVPPLTSCKASPRLLTGVFTLVPVLLHRKLSAAVRLLFALIWMLSVIHTSMVAPLDWVPSMKMSGSDISPMLSTWTASVLLGQLPLLISHCSMVLLGEVRLFTWACPLLMSVTTPGPLRVLHAPTPTVGVFPLSWIEVTQVEVSLPAAAMLGTASTRRVTVSVLGGQMPPLVMVYT